MGKILDWDKYLDTAANAVAEGIVMLKNDNDALPLKKNEEVAVFGRIQLHYYKSGTGSGGMVNVSKVTGIVDGLLESGVKINQELLDVYQKWDSENPFDLGAGWGMEPWSQEEMELEDDFVKHIAESADAAIVVLGRTAGEEQDNHLAEGSYLLTQKEKAMLATVRRHFSKMIVLLNVGNIIDMSYFEECKPDALLYVWQGGMTGGTGTADVLTGEVSPSGRLPDTIACEVADYPSAKDFGDTVRNYYTEDIYVGYRYFETFAKDKVKYPFGYGMSYTTFSLHTGTVKKEEDVFYFDVTVKNTGSYAGKEVVQIYCEAPQGKLGKPSRILCGYGKTKTLEPGEETTVTVSVQMEYLASYDDEGVTGKRFCFVLEEGEYVFCVGTDVRNAKAVYTYRNESLVVISEHKQALAPVREFKRMKAGVGEDGLQPVFEAAPLSEVDEAKRRLENLPKEIAQVPKQGIVLADVEAGKNSMEEFIAQFTDEDLAVILRGEGMNSPKVTAGTASAFGGVSDSLKALGIPCACCADGPSGMRMDCGTKAFSLPNGTMLASTFNDKLIYELYDMVGLEMAANNVDCLLGPGINIHRHPLNGRNFEYFSEDPYLTGKMAAVQLRGMQMAGVTGTIKHFCANNQETCRHSTDAVVSERALREIYLRGFEIAVKEGNANSVMTTYGSVNGLWTAGNYDLNTTILRDEWGFKGIVMTDWWAKINERDKEADKENFAAMAKAQNDLYMVCADVINNTDNLLPSLNAGTLNRSEMQRNAMNICEFLIHTNAMKRFCKKEEEIVVNNRPADAEASDQSEVKCYKLDGEIEIPLKGIKTEKGTSYSFSLDVSRIGVYEVTLTASSTQGELAQIPVTIFWVGTAQGTFTWNGTGGKPVSFVKEINAYSRFPMVRLYFAQSGLDMESISLRYLRPLENE